MAYTQSDQPDMSSKFCGWPLMSKTWQTKSTSSLNQSADIKRVIFRWVYVMKQEETFKA